MEQNTAVVAASEEETCQMHVKSFRMKVDSVDEENGTFDAYASVFNVLDSDAEIVMPGAFNRSLKNNQGVVVLADHDVKKHIGFNIEAHEDGYGLRVKAQLALENSAARDKYALIKLAQKLSGEGLPVKAGISIGFRAIQTKMMSGRELKSVKGADPNRTYRCFTECALVEYSVVALAANQEAYVTAAKARYDENSRKLVASALDADAEKADKPTKRVAGEDLEASAFLIVGDEADTSTWKLPVKFSTEAKTKRHIRNALARINQLKDVSADEKTHAVAELKRISKEHGIDVADDKSQKDFNESLTEARNMSALYQERCEIESALYDAIQDVLGDEETSTDDKKAEITDSYQQYAAAMADWYSRFMDVDVDNDPEEDLEAMDGKTEKAGRAISAATAEQIKQAMGHLTDAGAMHQKALGILTSLSKQAYTANDVNQPNPVGEGKEEKAASDPEIDHSLEELLELVRSVDVLTKAA